MMMLRKSRVLAPAVGILLLATGGCKGVDLGLELPPETQEGKNKFGCKVNDALWLPYTDHTLDRALEPEHDGKYFTLRAERETGDATLINLRVYDTAGLKPGRYSADEGFFATVTFTENGDTEEYICEGGAANSIILTKVEQPAPDGSIEVIVSGTFSFVATAPLSSKTVRVTEGRFDIKTR